MTCHIFSFCPTECISAHVLRNLRSHVTRNKLDNAASFQVKIFRGRSVRPDGISFWLVGIYAHAMCSGHHG